MGLDLLERKATITTGLDWLQFLKQFFIHACSQSNSDGSVKNRAIRVRLITSSNDTLMKNCFKDWRQSTTK